MRNRSASLFLRARKEENGSAAIEFGFIGFLLVLLTLGIFEVGRVIYLAHRLSHAVGDTSRWVGAGATNQAIIDGVKAHFPPNERGSVAVSVTSPVINGGTYRRVEARYPIPLIVPGLGIVSGNTFTIRSVNLIPTG